jgi:hypothetical protein
MLCRIARRNAPVADGMASSAAIEPAPADWPNIVTLPGSPPNAAMFVCVHSSAASWSSSARLSGDPAIRRSPSAPVR